MSRLTTAGWRAFTGPKNKSRNDKIVVQRARTFPIKHPLEMQSLSAANIAFPSVVLPQMPYTPILATLGYVLSPDRKRVLLVHRNARLEDAHLGKYNGLGGKLEADEDVIRGMRREIREEAAIECTQMSMRGTISWPGFGKAGEDWFGFLFLISEFAGTVPASNAEGTLEWIDRERILELPLWEGDRLFLPLVFDTDPRAFHAVMPYRDGRLQSWSFSRI